MLSGGLMAVEGRGASEIGATFAGGWLVVEGEFVAGSDVEMAAVADVDSGDSFVDRPLADSGLGEVIVIILELGLVIGIADLGTVRDAIALARARW